LSSHKRGRKPFRDVDAKWNIELWEQINKSSENEFATEKQIGIIIEISKSVENVSQLFVSRIREQLECHPLRLSILLWLECVNPKTYTYQVVENIAKAFLEDDL